MDTQLDLQGNDRKSERAEVDGGDRGRERGAEERETGGRGWFVQVLLHKPVPPPVTQVLPTLLP
jgi:hypothetical protein